MNELTHALITTSTSDPGCAGELLVKNHCVPLPCGYVSPLALEDDCGYRIPESNFVGNPSDIRYQANDARPSVFAVNPYSYPVSDGLPVNTPNEKFPVFGQDLTRVDYNRYHRFYKIVGNSIQTSFCEGFIKLHYMALPVDTEGYPLIPNNENLKQAIEFHVLKRMIGSGYEHKVFDYKMANDLYEMHAARARSEISYPTLDDMQRNFNTNIRLIPPTGYADEFFIP